jgi:phage regulator Rha-like protein
LNMKKPGIISHELAINTGIQSRIHTIRGVQVMLDEDLAELYGVETKNLNRAVKRNIKRFPLRYMFQLSKYDFDTLRFQNGTLEKNKSLRFQNGTLEKNKSLKSQIMTLENERGKHRKYLPYAFTEQGVAMLSAVLKSDVAVEASIQIIDAFVAMRRFILSNAQIFQRLDSLELKQLETDKRMEVVLNAIESKDIQPRQGIFFEGQVFDAYKFVSDLFRSAEDSIVIIDNYLDDSVLIHLTKRKKNVKVLLLTRNLSETLALDVSKFNKQYQEIEIKLFNNSHDRFIIIDNSVVYHFGASLKDLGKKWFAFSKMDIGAGAMLAKLDSGNLIV